MISVIAGLSKMSNVTFAAGVMIGRAIMVILISYVGADIFNLAQHPLKIGLLIVLIPLFWFMGKYVNERLNR